MHSKRDTIRIAYGESLLAILVAYVEQEGDPK